MQINNAWEAVILILYLANFPMYAYMHGKPKEGNYNFWVGAIGTILTLWVLYGAGLFH